MKKKLVIITAAVLAALLLFMGYKTFLAPKGVEGTKKVTIQIVNKDKKIDTIYTFKTDHEFLHDLLVENEKKLGATFKKFDFGTMVTGMGNYVAEDAKKEFFSLSVNDVDALTGPQEIPIKDGDKYKFELKNY